MSGINLGDARMSRHGGFLVGKDLVKAEPILDSASDDIPTDAPTDAVLDAAAESFGSSVHRSQAMGIALTFVEDGEYVFDAVDDLVRGVVGIDEAGESDPTDEESEQYNDLAETVLDSLVSLGADQAQASSFMQSEDDTQGEVLGSFLATQMDETVLDDATIINRFAVAENLEFDDADGVLDAAKIKKIRGGKVVWVTKKIGPKKRMSAKQKMALKKARLKSNSSAAKAKRAKSSRIAEKMGL